MGRWNGGIVYLDDKIVARVPTLQGGIIEEVYFYDETVRREYTKSQAREWQRVMGIHIWKKYWTHVKKHGHLHNLKLKTPVAEHVWSERHFTVTRSHEIKVERFLITRYYNPKLYISRIAAPTNLPKKEREAVIVELQKRYHDGAKKYPEFNSTIKKSKSTSSRVHAKKSIPTTQPVSHPNLAQDMILRQQFKDTL